ncbi:acetyl-CoA carboxylase beta subunit [Bradyrhizobium sp. LB7.2]
MNWKPELDELARREAFAREMGGVDKVKRQHDQGRLTVRERIDRLTDKGSFHEIGAVSGIGEYDSSGELQKLTPANCVFGRARVDGRTVVVVGDDFTVRGGSADASISAKPLMAEEMAHDFRLPIVRIIEGSGGGGSVKTIETKGAANLPGGIGGTRWYRFTTENLSRVPVVALGLGSVAGLGAARLAASHYSIMTKKSAMFVAGPPVVKALGQDLSKEELGGADIQTRAGAVDHAVDTEEEAFACARRFLSYLPSSVYELPPTLPCTDHPERTDEALMNAVPRNRKQVYKMRPIIESVVDKGSFFEVARNFGKPVIVGLARLEGRAVMLLAQRQLSLRRLLDRGCLPEGGALGRLRRDLPFADRLSHGLPRLHDWPRCREGRHDPSRRPRHGRGQPDHGALVHGDPAQRLRRRRRGASAGRPLLDPLRLALGLLGLAPARRRHRSRLPRRHRRGRRFPGEAEGDPGAPQQAALAVPLRRKVLGRGDHRSPEDEVAAVRVRATGGAAAQARAAGEHDDQAVSRAVEGCSRFAAAAMA